MAELTYAEVGATRDGPLPRGYRHLQQRVGVGTGRESFMAAAAGLRDFQMQRGAGLRVRPAGVTAALGAEVSSGLGIGPLRLWAPCRVVWLIDESSRYGYGYGTLPGHPESGEEGFEVWHGADDRVWFGLRSFSRPGRALTRLGWPVATRVVDLTTRRYIEAMKALAQAPT